MKLNRFYLLLIFFICNAGSLVAQQISAADSVKFYLHRYSLTKSDADLFKLEFSKSRYYRRLNDDSSLFYANLQLELAKQKNNTVWEAAALSNKEYALRELGNLADALTLQFRVLEMSKQFKTGTIEGQTLNSIGNTYLDMGDARMALKYYQQSLSSIKKLTESGQPALLFWEFNEISNIGNAYEILNKPDSALFFELQMYHNKKFPDDLLGELTARIGNAYVKLGKYDEALKWYRKGLGNSAKQKGMINVMLTNYLVAKVYQHLNRPDSAIHYGQIAFINANSGHMKKLVLNSSKLLADLYGAEAKIDSAYHYQQIATKLNDTLFGTAKFNRIQHVLSDEQQRQQNLLQQQKDLASRYRLIGGAALLVFILILAILMGFNYREQRKKNRHLAAQKTQITEQRDELQNILIDLRKTQTQLIQSEKMASLGELTAGIAHEIQNPLNFVNNFSELNAELVGEIKLEIEKGDLEEINAIAIDIEENSKIINMHGKRA